MSSNKKRKNQDMDKSVVCSSLCWEDIERIYNFEDYYELKPSNVPDAAIELLLASICDVRDLYGQITDGDSYVRILVEEDVVGEYVHLQGRFLTAPINRVVWHLDVFAQAKHDAGNSSEYIGARSADRENLTVTNFLEWSFLISEETKVRKHNQTLLATMTTPSFEGLKEIVGKIYTLLSKVYLAHNANS
ncbi:Crinkler (CRN) family protein [Thraustotheca clavata]|uniref:Crinkler (CRN) family protein n=1 Tax=Thraustotheca clavata TaxID=74557 RepID=A0A1V9Y6P2_9STRA|nr:Crinkler (CRN) family protein [Thraustotheca clavata]